MRFVNREEELTALRRLWEQEGSAIGVLYGRRRVGKTVLLQHFSRELPVVFHTAGGRPPREELEVLSAAAASVVDGGFRDLGERPFTGWDDAIETLAAAASERPLLLILDEFPELIEAAPDLPGRIRAIWDRVRGQTRLKILLSGSAVRVMEAVQEERSPLYGRVDLSLLLHPFGPQESALMLDRLEPAERARVWGIVGGMPLYLEWWDQSEGLEENLARLACTPGGPLLTEGQLVLATEAEEGDLARRALYAIAAGRTRFNEIEQALGADPTRTLDRLVSLRLIERVAPVTETGRKSRRRIYRIADNFLAFWLGVLDRHRAEVERGLGPSILPTLVASLDDHLGRPWEEAFRSHLRRMAAAGQIGPEIVAVGPFWTAAEDPAEIDAVALAGRSRTPVLVGEAKWSSEVDARPIRATLERKAASVPGLDAEPTYLVAAREEVTNAEAAGVLALTAADIFSPG